MVIHSTISKLKKICNLQRRDYLLFIIKRISFLKVNRHRKCLNLDENESLTNTIAKQLLNKDEIDIVLSGPSALNLKYNSDNYYFTTNNSINIIKKYSNDSSLYFLYDPFFTYRYIHFNRIVENSHVVFFYPRTRFPSILKWNKSISNDIRNCLVTSESEFGNKEYLLFGEDSELLKIEDFFYNKLNWDGEFYNSGIVLVMLAAYFSFHFDKKINVYGLDMGIGGKIHIDSKNSMSHPSFYSDNNLIGISRILQNVKNLLGDKFTNSSYFKTYDL